jgi:hypothetical protein
MKPTEYGQSTENLRTRNVMKVGWRNLILVKNAYVLANNCGSRNTS